MARFLTIAWAKGNISALKMEKSKKYEHLSLGIYVGDGRFQKIRNIKIFHFFDNSSIVVA